MEREELARRQSMSEREFIHPLAPKEAVNLASLIRQTNEGEFDGGWELYTRVQIGEYSRTLKKFTPDGNVSIKQEYKINNELKYVENEYDLEYGKRILGEGYMELGPKDRFEQVQITDFVLVRNGEVLFKSNTDRSEALTEEFQEIHAKIHPNLRVDATTAQENHENRQQHNQAHESDEASIQQTDTGIRQEAAHAQRNIVRQGPQQAQRNTRQAEEQPQDNIARQESQLDTQPTDAQQAQQRNISPEERQAIVDAVVARMEEQEGNTIQIDQDEQTRIIASAVVAERIRGEDERNEIIRERDERIGNIIRERDERIDQIIQEKDAQVSQVERIKNEEVEQIAQDRDERIRENESKFADKERQIDELIQGLEKTIGEQFQSQEEEHLIALGALEVQMQNLEIEIDELRDGYDEELEEKERELAELRESLDRLGKSRKYNGAVKRADGKFASPVDELTRAEREEGVEAEIKIDNDSLIPYELDNGMMVGFPKLLRNKDDVLRKLNELASTSEFINHDHGWQENEIRKLIKRLRPKYTKEMLAQIRYLTAEVNSD